MPELLTYGQEVRRKIIHLSSSSIALIVYIYGKDFVLPFAISIGILLPILDYLRQKNLYLQNFYYIMFNDVTRYHEKNTLSGASWVFIGSSITILLFEQNIIIISILIMSLSDSFAAIIGIKYGKTKLFDKSLEGTFAFLLTTTVIVFLFSNANYFINILTILIATICELFSSKLINDNIIIPIVSGLILSLSIYL